MYEPLLWIHSWLRWVVLIALVVLIVRCLIGWVRGSAWTPRDQHLLWAFDQTFGYQILFGLTLWAGMSPYSKAFFKIPELVFDNGMVFFWALRHPLTMLTAIIFFKIIKHFALKEQTGRRFGILGMGLITTFLVIVSAIPWPWLDIGRALFRGWS